MKQKIFTIIFAIAFTASAYGERYLVQTGNDGDLKWDPAVEGTVINLGSTSLNNLPIPSGIAAGDEIWIIGGTYKTLATVYFNKSGVLYYGGFSGTENSVDQRPMSDLDGNGIIEPWEFANLTIIDAQASAESKFRCVTMVAGTNVTADGFVMQGGVASSGPAGVDVGTTCILRNSIVRNNMVRDVTVTVYSGGVSTSNIVESCLIEKNIIDETVVAAAYGAGISGSAATSVISNCVIRNNQNRATGAQGNVRGGGVYLSAGGKIYNSVVTNNYAYGQGGGIFSNNATGSAANRIVSCTVANNKASAGTGGVMLNQMGEMYNSIVFDNYNNTTLHNWNITANGTATVGYGYNSACNGGTAGSGSFTTSVTNLSGAIDAYFALPNTIIGPSDDVSVDKSNWNLKSDAIAGVSNAGADLSATDVAESGAKDFNGIARSSTPDLGAHEYTKYEVTVASSNASHGTVSGSGSYYPFSIVQVTATPEADFEFSAWTNGQDEVSTDAAYQFVATGDVSLVANFKSVVGINPDNYTFGSYVKGKTLFVTTSEPVSVEIYTIDGTRILGIAVSVDQSVELQQGAYIVVLRNGVDVAKRKIIVY